MKNLLAPVVPWRHPDRGPQMGPSHGAPADLESSWRTKQLSASQILGTRTWRCGRFFLHKHSWNMDENGDFMEFVAGC